jgi:TonB family protein
MLIVLLLTAGSAWGEWTGIGKMGDETIYLDFATIRRTGNLVKAWTLWDYKTVRTLSGGGGYLSAKAQMQLDCEEEGLRTIAFVEYSGHMGEGNVAYSNSDPTTTWDPVVPGTIGETLFNTVCSKQRERQDARNRVESQQRTLQQKTVDEFMAQIQASIRSHIVIPANMSGNPEVIYHVVLFANGTLINTTLAKSSGVPAYDEAVLRAMHAAEPLPLPRDPELFQQAFRELRLAFRPNE